MRSALFVAAALAWPSCLAAGLVGPVETVRSEVHAILGTATGVAESIQEKDPWSGPMPLVADIDGHLRSSGDHTRMSWNNAGPTGQTVGRVFAVSAAADTEVVGVVSKSTLQPPPAYSVREPQTVIVLLSIGVGLLVIRQLRRKSPWQRLS